MRRLLLALVLAAAACGESATPATGLDATTAADGSSIALDSGVANPPADSGVNGGTDAGTIPGADASPPSDAAAPAADAGVVGADTGAPPPIEVVPGSHVTTSKGRVSVGDTFMAVKAALGNPDRRTPTPATAMASPRSYEYDLPNAGGMLVVWFANTNLDRDDNAPNDVDATDQVLWVAVNGAYAGRTPGGLGIGSAKADVERVQGPPERSVPVTDPPGTLLSYYTAGVLYALDAQNAVRTITVSRRYPHAPNARIDINGGALQFAGAGNIAGGLGGTREGDVRRVLGPPDAEGDVDAGGQTVTLMSYAFIGIEVFILPATSSVLFTNVHPPFFGTTGMAARDVAIGSTRTELEAYVTQEGFGPAAMSRLGNGVVCYKKSGRAVGATYTMDATPLVSSIIVAHPQTLCP